VSEDVLLVHSMGEGLTVADWPALTPGEANAVLARFGRTESATITWRSPRPMSSAAIIEVGDVSCFLKRHDRRVRDAERLRLEHRVADHLRARGVRVPRPWRREDAESVVERAEYLYEVHDLARGRDLYRDVPSWRPYATLEHARAAGATLARFHRALEDLDLVGSPAGVLGDSQDLLRGDLAETVGALVAARPALADALQPYEWREDLEALRARADAARSALSGLAPQWTHGDWHPSNLTWDGDAVVEVMDLGLANRTTAVHDLALALERACVDWLAESGRPRGDAEAARALIEGYQSCRPLRAIEREALVAVLPVCHLDFALSEVEYFHGVTGSAANTDLAYRGYFLGHVEWFSTPEGEAFVERVGEALV